MCGNHIMGAEASRKINQETRTMLGEMLRTLRTGKNMSVRSLAALVGLSNGYLSTLERNLAGPPSEQKLRALASVLGVNPDALLIAAHRLPADVRDALLAKPELLDLVRRAVGEEKR
jgi:transcriptional regulator with XRE-family HTH domain